MERPRTEREPRRLTVAPTPSAALPRHDARATAASTADVVDLHHELVPADTYEEWGPTSLVAVDATPLQSIRESAAYRDGAELGSGPDELSRAGWSDDLTSHVVEAVATALETAALRVRTGELVPRGYDRTMDDAAAIASALTAILAMRR